MNEKIIKRFLQYRLCLNKFKDLGFERIFSYYLGKEAGVSAEQVRKDFSFCGIKGNKKAGYNVDELLVTIKKLLKCDEVQDVIVVGMGNIGRALTQFINSLCYNLKIVAAFDIDPSKIKKDFIIPIYPVDAIEDYLKKNSKIKIAVISVPERAAQELCNLLIDSGIKGILNFSPVILKAPDNILIRNVNLFNELKELVFTSGL